VKPMRPSVLITGFGPFPGAPFNPTETLVRRLGARRRPALADVARHTHVVHVSYAAVDRELPGLVARHAPDVLLMFGLAARTPHMRIETQARNTVSALVPDAGGHLRHARCIQAGEPAAIAGRAPFRRLVSVARAARVPTQLSRNAGSYLCNYIYWRGIETRGANGKPSIVVFVHVPLIGRACRPLTDRRRLTLDQLAWAAEAILVALVAAARGAQSPRH
jgi:pyroglutamyl-peptidase